MTDRATALSERAAELRRTFDQAFAEPRRDASPPTADLLAISVASDRYAVPLGDLAGVFADRKVTPVPTTAAALLGLSCFRGAIVPTFDLGALLGYPPRAPPRWVVVAKALPVAFAVDALEAYLRVGRDAVAPAPPDGGGRHVRDVVRTADGVRPIVHMASLLDVISKGGPEVSRGKER